MTDHLQVNRNHEHSNLSHVVPDGKLPAARFLLQHKVCPRCCLRLLGVEGPYYSQSATLDRLVQHIQEAADQPDADQFATTSPVTVTRDVCTVCLGMLQDQRECKTDVSEDNKENKQEGAAHTESAQLPADSPAEGGTWQWVVQANADSLINMLQKEGHAMGPFTLEVSVPAAVAVRESITWGALKDKFGEVGDFKGSMRESVVDIKDAFRSMIGPSLKKATGGFSHDPNASLRICVCFKHKAFEHEADFLQSGGDNKSSGKGKGAGWGKRGRQNQQLSSSINYSSAQMAASKLSWSELCEGIKFPLSTPRCPCQTAMKAWRQPVRIAGRYLKLLRGLPQSPWGFSDDPSVPNSSVQDVLSDHFKPLLGGAGGCKIISAGREDRDVRMLGSGRPFVLEFSNPRRDTPSQQELDEAGAALARDTKGVEVKNIQSGTPAILSALKEGEEHKEKTYEALCWLKRALEAADGETLNSIKNLTIEQATPVRVMHRRAPLTREKLIKSVECFPIAGRPHYFRLRLTTGAGAYVKEFVHGDFGRTRPSIGDLLNSEAEILQLDVTDVHMDVL